MKKVVMYSWQGCVQNVALLGGSSSVELIWGNEWTAQRGRWVSNSNNNEHETQRERESESRQYRSSLTGYTLNSIFQFSIWAGAAQQIACVFTLCHCDQWPHRCTILDLFFSFFFALGAQNCFSHYSDFILAKFKRGDCTFAQRAEMEK